MVFSLYWTKEAQGELNKVPGFVRGKIKRNTEEFARERNLEKITLEVIHVRCQGSCGCLETPEF